MPKISEHGGPSEGPWDAPNVEVSEEQYTEIMGRHGTPEWTREDEELARVYRERKAAKEKGGEDVSPGNSSSESSSNNEKTSGKTGTESRQPAPTTVNPSRSDPEESSTARVTGGSIPATGRGRR